MMITTQFASVCTGWAALHRVSMSVRKAEAQGCLVKKSKLLEDGLDHPCKEPCDRVVRGRNFHHHVGPVQSGLGVSIKLPLSCRWIALIATTWLRYTTRRARPPLNAA